MHLRRNDPLAIPPTHHNPNETKQLSRTIIHEVTRASTTTNEHPKTKSQAADVAAAHIHAVRTHVHEVIAIAPIADVPVSSSARLRRTVVRPVPISIALDAYVVAWRTMG